MRAMLPSNMRYMVGNNNVFAGHLFSAEAVTLPSRQNSEYRPNMLDTQLCFWKEDPEHDKLYVTCLRLYVRKHVVGTSSPRPSVVIGYKDFVPEYNGRSKENKGYEVRDWSVWSVADDGFTTAISSQ